MQRATVRIYTTKSVESFITTLCLAIIAFNIYIIISCSTGFIRKIALIDVTLFLFL